MSSSFLDLLLLTCLESAALILVCQAVTTTCLRDKLEAGNGWWSFFPSKKGGSKLIPRWILEFMYFSWRPGVGLSVLDRSGAWVTGWDWDAPCSLVSPEAQLLCRQHCRWHCQSKTLMQLTNSSPYLKDWLLDPVLWYYHYSLQETVIIQNEQFLSFIGAGNRPTVQKENTKLKEKCLQKWKIWT